jgi:DNA-binding response OmpR family regulator
MLDINKAELHSVSTTRHILIIDDDEDLVRTLIEQFEVYSEFRCSSAHDARSGMEQVNREHVDILILDVGLPDMDGRDACRIMRDNGFNSPILMLTAEDTDTDQILGLDAGANDYVTKPFKFAVLLARMRSHLRQHEHSEDAIFTVGPYTFRPAKKMLVSESGDKIRLTEKETDIIKYLYRAGRGVGRETLLNEVWGYNTGITTHTLETHIYRLRQKIEPDPANATLLITEEGGYRLRP